MAGETRDDLGDDLKGIKGKNTRSSGIVKE
jgi:hypothetical protein